MQPGSWAAILRDVHMVMKAHPAVEDALYQRRSALMASTVVAWSTPMPSSHSGCNGSCGSVLLAVGTKLGHVWLWRCRLGQTASDDDSKPCFELVGHACQNRQPRTPLPAPHPTAPPPPPPPPPPHSPLQCRSMCLWQISVQEDSRRCWSHTKLPKLMMPAWHASCS